tara:strand:+ start:192 stop:590 length:399 start_codon:yes stop_codon:yes gene_type:complete
MDRFADEEAPDITTAMNNIKSRYLNNIRSKHDSTPNFFSNRPSILEVIENNMSEWENLCLRKIFDESDLVVNNKIIVSYSGWIIIGSQIIMNELVKESSIYYLNKIENKKMYKNNIGILNLIKILQKKMNLL